MKRLFSRKFGALIASSVVCVGTLAAVSGSLTTSASAASSGTDITYALPPAVVPNYIFPVMGSAYYSNVNLYQFQSELFRPLYWFGQGTAPSFNEKLSLALPPVYSNAGKTVTIKLKKYNWSDGKPVTADDVLFFMQMLKAEKSIWPVYVPGEFPDNVTAMSAPNASTVVFTLNSGVLDELVPLQRAEPDHPAAVARVGQDVGELAPSATPTRRRRPVRRSVWNYLTAQAKSPTTYATNPLWQIVDGPFKLKSFSTTGLTVFVPNPKYSGPTKADYAELTLEPFTTDAAEFNALRAGTLDYGYVPPEDSSQIPLLKSDGYSTNPWIGWSINYFPMNMNNPTVGPIFRQLYFRQAFQEMVNQPTDIKKALYGYGYPDLWPRAHRTEERSRDEARGDQRLSLQFDEVAGAVEEQWLEGRARRSHHVRQARHREG